MSRFREKFAMPAVFTIDDLTRARLLRLEAVARAGGRDVLQARQAVARWVGASSGALEGVRRGRVKGVKAWLAGAVKNAFVEILKRELSELENELALAEAGGRIVDGDAEEAARLVEEARELIGGKP